MLAALLSGLGLGLSLIVAIGAQNLFVLRQGMRREHVLLVAGLCAASDAALIALGVSGVGLVVEAVPWLIDVVRWAGAAFLVGYGCLAARRAWRPTGQAMGPPDPETGARGAGDGAASEQEFPADAGRSRRAATAATAKQSRALPVILTCLALTWLNPHVYLDTVFLLGGVASTHGDARWVFAAGAMTASALWFFGLALGARYLGRWLSTPRAWRVLDAAIAIVMIALGIGLVLPH
jgi:L-lysine exporter family protein LysE/ArgO